VRSLLPIFGFVLLITYGAFIVGNRLVPKAALEAYSLLYDIKQKKPALDIRQGAFYNSIPDISIKVNEKLPDEGILKGVIIYDHRGMAGNKKVWIADSGRMYTFNNDQYLKLELFHGYNYSEGSSSGASVSSTQDDDTYSKTQFSKTQIVFDLSSFGLNRTDKKWFQSNRIMRNMKELKTDMDSISTEIDNQRISHYVTTPNAMEFHHLEDSVKWPESVKKLKQKKDSIAIANSGGASPNTIVNSSGSIVRVVYKNVDSITVSKSDSIFKKPYDRNEISRALGQVRMVKNQLLNNNSMVKSYNTELLGFKVQWHKIMAQAIACIAMFLIGAPLGSIIKKGGLGVPVLMSIIFFIVFYVLTLMGEKWAKQGVLSVPVGMWLANGILFSIGLVFLRQARADARLFDSDFYNVVWDKFKNKFRKATIK
jgi:lipopolysaccharide export system permease protein